MAQSPCVRFAGLKPGYESSMGDVHIVPAGDAWACEVAGDKQEWFGSQDEAIRRGRELAQQERGGLVIHRKERIEVGRPVARNSWFPPSLDGPE
jgi:hypothetical protein